MERWKGGQTKAGTGKYANILTDRETVHWTDGWTNRWTDRQRDVWTDQGILKGEVSLYH
jgi:hypothetical protein